MLSPHKAGHSERNAQHVTMQDFFARWTMNWLNRIMLQQKLRTSQKVGLFGGRIMKIHLKQTILLSFLVMSLNCPSILAEKLVWFHADFPPASIVSGPDKGTGATDQVEKLLQKNLPEYEHVESVANFTRILEELRNNDSQVISASLLKTPEREEYIEFSVLSMVAFPNGSIFLKSRYPELKAYIDDTGTLDLEKVFAASKYTIGISKGRRYGGVIDDILAKYQNAPFIYTRTGTDMDQGLIQMMIEGRLDIILLYPTSAKYVTDKLHVSEKIMFLPIKGMSEYNGTWIGVPKTPWGKEMIGKINTILLEQRQTPEYLSLYEKWIYEESIPRYRELVKSVFERELTEIQQK